MGTDRARSRHARHRAPTRTVVSPDSGSNAPRSHYRVPRETPLPSQFSCPGSAVLHCRPAPIVRLPVNSVVPMVFHPIKSVRTGHNRTQPRARGPRTTAHVRAPHSGAPCAICFTWNSASLLGSPGRTVVGSLQSHRAACVDSNTSTDPRGASGAVNAFHVEHHAERTTLLRCVPSFTASVTLRLWSAMLPEFSTYVRYLGRYAAGPTEHFLALASTITNLVRGRGGTTTTKVGGEDSAFHVARGHSDHPTGVDRHHRGKPAASRALASALAGPDTAYCDTCPNSRGST